MNRGFSFASVILSYFLVGGGVVLGLFVSSELKMETPYFAYILFAFGALVGGFLAARASAGSTIVEPIIGALLFVATAVGCVALTDLGKLLWHVNPDATGKAIAAIAGSAAGGGLVGAFISEKLFGEASESTVPWVIYTGFASLGASFITVMVAAILVMSGKHANDDAVGGYVLLGMAIGCLLCGLAAGASARTRPLLATAIGCALGTPALFFAFGLEGGDTQKNAIAAVAFAVGGAILGLIGAAIGWATVGKKYANA